MSGAYGPCYDGIMGASLSGMIMLKMSKMMRACLRCGWEVSSTRGQSGY